MKPAVVVDVGNTRVKWGLCSAQAVVAMAALPADDPAAWERQREQWTLPTPAVWVLAGVQPSRLEVLAEWLRQRHDHVCILRDPRQLPLTVLLEHPEKAGIDRLLDAVAANSRRRAKVPAVLIDAGSAVTIDWLDENGAFRGGAIMPGFRLMAQALHDHTALLPLIAPPSTLPSLPGTSTAAALEAGIFWAVAGGIQAVVDQLAASAVAAPDIFLTGGDASVLRPLLNRVLFWPEMTLEGIRLAVETLS